MRTFTRAFTEGLGTGWMGRQLLALGVLLVGCMLLAAGGCGSSTAVVQDFTLAVAPATVALTAAGATQQITVTSTAVNGDNAAIALTFSGLPAGVTANPASVVITPGASETITLTAGRTHVMPGVVHLVVFGSFLFFALVP